MDSKLIVIAIGGNSLIEDSKHVTVSAQYEAASKTAYRSGKDTAWSSSMETDLRSATSS